MSIGCSDERCEERMKSNQCLFAPITMLQLFFFLTTGPTGFLDKPFLDFTRGAPVPNFFFSKLLPLVWSACRFLTLPPLDAGERAAHTLDLAMCLVSECYSSI